MANAEADEPESRQVRAGIERCFAWNLTGSERLQARRLWLLLRAPMRNLVLVDRRSCEQDSAARLTAAWLGLGFSEGSAIRGLGLVRFEVPLHRVAIDRSRASDLRWRRCRARADAAARGMNSSALSDLAGLGIRPREGPRLSSGGMET